MIRGWRPHNQEGCSGQGEDMFPRGNPAEENEPLTHLHGTPKSHAVGAFTAQCPLPAAGKSAIPQRPGSPHKGPMGHPHSGEDRSRVHGDASLLRTRRLRRTALTPQACSVAGTNGPPGKQHVDGIQGCPARTARVSGTLLALPRRKDSTSRCL